jgi:putative protease
MKKTYLGKITNFYAKPGVAEIKLENGDLAEGETILITGPTTGALEIKVTGLRDAGKNESPRVGRGELCSIKTPERVRKSDKVFKWESIPR